VKRINVILRAAEVRLSALEVIVKRIDALLRDSVKAAAQLEHSVERLAVIVGEARRELAQYHEASITSANKMGERVYDHERRLLALEREREAANGATG
jgi:hypothetical protein